MNQNQKPVSLDTGMQSVDPPNRLVGNAHEAATGLGRRFFEETPYGLSVEGHLENTARLNTSFDNQGWLNAKQNVALPCPGKPRPTWPPHWIYPMPRSNETELVRYPGTETRVTPFVPQISPDFVPPNDNFNIESPDESETRNISLSQNISASDSKNKNQDGGNSVISPQVPLSQMEAENNQKNAEKSNTNLSFNSPKFLVPFVSTISLLGLLFVLAVVFGINYKSKLGKR